MSGKLQALKPPGVTSKTHRADSACCLRGEPLINRGSGADQDRRSDIGD
jgi:hypothetical protein